MEPQPGRNYITNNYQYYHHQMLGKRLNFQNNNHQNNNQATEGIRDNEENAENKNAFFIHPQGLRTSLSENDMDGNINNETNYINNNDNNNNNNDNNNDELLLESPNPFGDENHPDFEKEILENHSFNLNELSINNQHQLIPNDNQENNKDQLIDLTQSWNDRLSWDNYFICIAFLIASRSTCNRLNVGCVLVKDTRIISVGYNGFLPKMPHQSIVRDNHEQATVHAEQNAVSDCAKRGIKMDGATAYITHYPCLNCFKILAASGISAINYHIDYKNDDIVKLLSQNAGIDINKI
jgi:dCMP deaminase